MSNRARETIIECIRKAQYSGSNEEDIRQQALQTLVAVTKISPQNRNFVAQIDGAISLLLSLSKSHFPQDQIQILALSVLFNLSLNPNLKNSLARTELILHLNTLVLSSNDSIDSGKLAASLLCSLAMLDKNKAKFGVTGTVQVLVKAIAGPRRPASHHLLSSLAELVQFQGNCTLAVRAGAVQVLIAVAESADGEDLSGTSLVALGLIARFEEGLNELKRTDRIVVRMVGILKRGCMLSKDGASEILLRLFDESEECLRDAVALPELSSVLADVSVRCTGRARKKAGLLMNKVMVASV
ncbi:hypothetical protein ABFS82_01G031300 [Erythranthe guttata]|uniref:U-box domain-containing protein n=1 Tax=Erythranthe guttata TaxID=4155 RepID=A0A022Q210_ERYGU|nr:PREDICTED: uncharacterized protein LOC105975149 [Erythranthe guttata]EYU21956.1 hypothetical protein MIMGU_mgv1a025552mg [Erythranthe guttata]|eukprot:XP_012855780.1 PREDICTED: uncharacterized protein LOC105975149 [Erythranthe guttata]